MACLTFTESTIRRVAFLDHQMAKMLRKYLVYARDPNLMSMAQINFGRLFGILFTAFILILVFIFVVLVVAQKLKEKEKYCVNSDHNTINY